MRELTITLKRTKGTVTAFRAWVRISADRERADRRIVNSRIGPS